MKANKYFTGSIFQFYVFEIKRYCYCKYFNFRNVAPLSGLLIQVFDKFSEQELSDLSELSSCGYLFGAKSIFNWPNLAKKSGWKSVGVLLSPDDDIIPDFKSAQVFSVVVEDESKIHPWYPVRNLSERGKNCAYDQVKHLENRVLQTPESIVWRTGMEFCRKNKIPIDIWYDLLDDNVRSVYWQMTNMPVYAEIPSDLRGKALTIS